MNKPKTRTENIVVQEMENEILIYDLKDNKAFCLNETSAMIYQLCNGKNSVAEIANLMSIKLKTLISEEFIWLALDNFKKDNLLEEGEQFAISFNGLSRRQVIRKVGLGSLVMLPIISSVVAPVSAATASLGLLFAACASPSDCASNFCTQGPPRCCVPGTQGIRGANVCCDGTTANCNSQCCSNTGTISPNAGCAPFAGPFSIACPNS